MTNQETILKSIAFIDAHLKSDITVNDIAKQGFYSRYHFIRLFQNIAGISPKQYLLQRRLTESAHQLQHSNQKIADIAYTYQFNSHEVFTRAFQKKFGCSPSKVRKGTIIPSSLLLSPITRASINQFQKNKNQLPELVELKEKILVGIAHFIPDSSQPFSLIKEWTQFMHEVDFIQKKVVPESFFQVQFWSDNQDLGGMYYYIGVEVEDIKAVHPQFVIKVIPQGKYLRFIHKGLSKNVGYTYRYIYHQFLPNTDYQLPLSFNFEFYGPNYLSPHNDQSESYLFIPVVTTD